MARANQTKVRVVMSLHLPRQQHQRWTKAAKAKKAKSLAEFIRAATDRGADEVLGGEPEQATAEDAAA